MKEITIRLYDYDELSPEAKERALEEWRSEDVEHFWGREVEDTLTKLQEELGIPTVGIEKEYTLSSVGQLRTRFQAFVESLEIKKLGAEKEGRA